MEKLFSDAYRKAYEYEREDYKRDYRANENLLKETINVLKENGKTISHIQFVACNQGIIDLGQFFSLADRLYDDSFGGAEVLQDLVVVGPDWWLERHEYDGSEWWEYKERPKMPDKVWENPHLFYDDEYPDAVDSFL